MVAPTATVEMLPESPSDETLELMAAKPVEFAPALHASRRRTFGLEPGLLFAGVAAAALVATIVLFATGAWIAGIVCLGLTVGFGTMLASAIRHEPDSTAARLAARARDRGGSWARFISVATGTGASAAFERGRLRRRRARLQRRLQARLAPLGRAVLEDDQERMAALRSEAAELERAIKEAEREAAAVLDAARRRVGRERSTIQPTEALRVVSEADHDPGPAEQA